MTNYDDPTMNCPQCGAEHPDFDGLGFVAHVKPGYEDGCGWCSHPSRDGDGKGNMVCGICGDVKPEKEECAACGSLIVDFSYSIHRDGFCDGPEVPLCDACGAHETPTCGELWAAIRERRARQLKPQSSAALSGLNDSDTLEDAWAAKSRRLRGILGHAPESLHAPDDIVSWARGCAAGLTAWDVTDEYAARLDGGGE